MNPERQRVAIAEACGFEHWDAGGTGVVYLRRPTAAQREYWLSCGDKVTEKRVTQALTDEVPDYLNDLNAMHEVEKVLDDGIQDAGSLRYKYADQIYRVTVPNNQQPFRATAPQRAEAFLRTIEKWEGE